MNKFIKSCLVLALGLFLTGSLVANGLNLNGVGSKSIAMGGAFVGLSDDFSAVFYNPAGLSQMEAPSLSVFGSFILPKGSYQFDLLGIDTETNSRVYPTGALGYFKPLSDKVTVGVLAYMPCGAGADWNGNDLLLLSEGVPFTWESQVGVMTVAPSISYKMSEMFSIGLSLNMNYGMLKVSKPGIGQYNEDLSGMAFNATIGALFKPSDKFSIGVSFKTPYKVKLKGDATMSSIDLFGLPNTSEMEREATFPLWLAAGIAVKPTDNLTITADVHFTNWEKLDTIPATLDDVLWQLVLGNALDLDLRWEDTVQLRFGAEYKFSEAFALRAGFYTDPGPSPLATQNFLLPSIDYNVATLGFSFNTGKINVDFALEYLMGDERVVSLLEVDPVSGIPGTHNFNILVPNISVTFML